MKRLVTGILSGVITACCVLIPFSANAQLTAEDNTWITACRDNITLKTYSLTTAADCLKFMHADNDRVTGILSMEKPETAFLILTYSNALKDMGDFFSIPDLTPALIHTGYSIRFPHEGCVPCGMGFGPEPHKMFSWITMHAPSNLPNFKIAVLEWETLVKPAQAYLIGQNMLQDRWRFLLFSSRENYLQPWTKSEATRIMAKPFANITQEDIDLCEYIIMLLTEPTKTQLKDYVRAHRSYSNSKKAGGAVENKPQKTELKQVLAKLEAAKTSMDTFAQLQNTYDLSQISRNEIAIAAASTGGKESYSLNNIDRPTLAHKLETQLFNEIRGTKAGDRIIQFYDDPQYRASDDNILNIDIAKTDAIGYWRRREKKLVFGQEVIEDWLKKNNYTGESLFNDDQTQKKLARYFSSTFIHEATHQRQTAWAKANGLDNYRQLEKEVESFSTEGLFVLEKSQQERKAGNSDYSSQLMEMDVNNAKRLEETGTVGMRKKLVCYEIPSFEGQSAANLSNVLSLLGIMSDRINNIPDHAQKKKLIEMLTAEELRWYTLTMTKRDEDDAWIMQTLTEINVSTGAKAKKKTKAPPSPVK